MPTRLIRDGINDSVSINSLTLEAEVFYRRLLSIVDDHGRFEADPDLIRSRLFWRQADQWPPERIQAMLDIVGHCRAFPDNCGHCQTLITLYTVKGKKFLQVNNFGQRRRSKSRYPDIPNCLPSELNLSRLDNSDRHCQAVTDFDGQSQAVTDIDGQSQSMTDVVRLVDARASTPPSPPPSYVSKNGNTSQEEQEPPDKEAEEFSNWAEAAYARHPKKSEKVIAMHMLQKTFALNKPARIVFDQNHALWCATEAWNEKSGNFAPKLAAWVSDDGWKSPPPKNITKLTGKAAARAKLQASIDEEVRKKAL